MLDLLREPESVAHGFVRPGDDGMPCEERMMCEFFIAIFGKKRTLLRMLNNGRGGRGCNKADRTLFP
jgi:hypothetical protein